ncbi:MAG: hypothetical protein KDK12_20385, partial [Rhodobacteraceae bacterium]|nr:hypothetical protein [Paracoccaceae bacterium]
FLLWGQDLSASGPGARPASDYLPGVGNNDRRRAYLQLVADMLVEDIHWAEEGWEPDTGRYRREFLELPDREALGRVFNGMAVLAGFEFMSERLAVSLDSGDQEDEHSCFSDTTHQDFVHDLKGIENVWTGNYPNAQGPGVREIILRVDRTLAEEVDALLADATAKVAALGDPWDQVLAAAPDSPARQAAEEAVTALQALGDGLRRAGNAAGVLVLIPAG